MGDGVWGAEAGPCGLRRRRCAYQQGGPGWPAPTTSFRKTFIRAWRNLPQLRADGRPIRPWLFRVARNLLTDADRASRSRPVTVAVASAEDLGDDSGLPLVLDRQLVCDALQHLSPAHRTLLVETFYRGGNTATVARRLGIPNGTARSRLHYALDAMRQHLQDQDATACR